MNFYIDDFTESNYLRLLVMAKQKYRFITYQDIKEAKEESIILLRHDVDCSMHRALRLAMIEAQQHVVCTYFFHLHSYMYNLLEDEIYKIGKEIIKLGHKIGVHFDPSFYGLKINETERFERFLTIEKQLLENLFDTPVRDFSFHDPDTGGWMGYEEFDACGMINAYSRYLKDNFTYCSDSNGYWRFKKLEDILNGGDKKLHILLHPEWWAPSVMKPRERITRCIDGRRDKCLNRYDGALKELGRLNVK
jgi:hypothetical protein